MMDYILQLHKQFLCRRPLYSIEWKISWESFSIDEQQELLKKTVYHTFSRKYPPSAKYIFAFLKYIILQLESRNIEVCGELYEEYAHLVQLGQVEEDDLCYKIYLLPEEAVIHLQESTNMISNGTTGLQTWQASQHLAEWSFENNDIFNDKRLLELGSGLGFTGLSIIAVCHPSEYTFSDCHQRVLCMLANNIDNNINRMVTSKEDSIRNIESKVECSSTKLEEVNYTCTEEQQRDSYLSAHHTSKPIGLHGQGNSEHFINSLWTGKWVKEGKSIEMWRHKQMSGVKVAKLDWESVSQTDLTAFVRKVDIIIATVLPGDGSRYRIFMRKFIYVVYDLSIIPPLVRLLNNCLIVSETNCTIYIASTIRNNETRDSFIHHLDEEKVKHVVVEGPKNEIFFYDRSTPIEILKLWK